MGNKTVNKSVFVGQILGVIYFISTLIFFWPNEELFLIKNFLFKIHFLIYSLAFWAICFTIITIVLFFFLKLINRNNSHNLTEFISSFSILFFSLIGYAVYYYYFYYTPLHYPSYLFTSEIILIILVVLIASILIALLITLILKSCNKSYKFKRFKDFYHQRLYKLSIYSFIFLLLYFMATSFYSHFSIRLEKSFIKPKNLKAVILGVDAASWNILIPLIKKGTLKNINKLIETSAYGYLDTFGEQFSPELWTSIATGKTSKKHSIISFTDSSYKWRAKSLWEILSDNGEKIGVINWMNTYPAFPFNGFLFSKIQKKSPNQHSLKYKEDFDIPIEELFIYEKQNNYGPKGEAYVKKLFNKLENLRRILTYCNNLRSYKLLCFFIYESDSVQHFFWHDFEPKHFRSLPHLKNANIRHANIFSICWKDIDKFVGEVMEELNDDTIFLIISDHGSRPIYKHEIFLNIEKILKTLNYLPSNKESSSDSLIFVINEEFIEVSKEISEYDFRKLCLDLKSIKFWPSKKPIFKNVKIIEDSKKRLIKIEFTRHLKVYSKKPRSIKIKGELYPFKEFFDLIPWSGRHRARGVIIMHGQGVNSRYLGSWIVDSPYFYLFRLLHGRIYHLSKLYPLLKYFRLVDPVTTLDITPTLLPLLGYPIALDMDGKDLSSFIAPKVIKNKKTLKSYGKSAYFEEKRKLDKRQIKKIKEELKALGYIK